jgi:hypothetical protein
MCAIPSFILDICSIAFSAASLIASAVEEEKNFSLVAQSERNDFGKFDNC